MICHEQVALNFAMQSENILNLRSESMKQNSSNFKVPTLESPFILAGFSILLLLFIVLTFILSLKTSPYSELFWSVFSRSRTECGQIIRISPYSVRMRENAKTFHTETSITIVTDQRNWNWLIGKITYNRIYKLVIKLNIHSINLQFVNIRRHTFIAIKLNIC